jgi:hypothetical protein
VAKTPLAAVAEDDAGTVTGDMPRGRKFPIWKLEKLSDIVHREFSLEDWAQAFNESAEVLEKELQRAFHISFAELASMLRRRQVKITRKAAKEGNPHARAWLKERSLLKDG